MANIQPTDLAAVPVPTLDSIELNPFDTFRSIESRSITFRSKRFLDNVSLR